MKCPLSAVPYARSDGLSLLYFPDLIPKHVVYTVWVCSWMSPLVHPFSAGQAHESIYVFFYVLSLREWKPYYLPCERLSAAGTPLCWRRAVAVSVCWLALSVTVTLMSRSHTLAHTPTHAPTHTRTVLSPAHWGARAEGVLTPWRPTIVSSQLSHVK